ncbi:MAG TPA: M23 family metallopeptidase [Caulobacter sp.]|nr:M23 family metallopeptidase [Caulobacter sp.]
MKSPALPAVVLLALAALPGVGAAETYRLPLSGADLATGERFSTFVHTGGIQAEGKDIGARRNKGGKDWSGLRTDGADRKVLSNWQVYGKPFYAMASGVVIGCWRNAPENVPGSYHPDYEAKKIAGGGNHLWIRQDDGVVALYAHAQPGSIPSNLCPHEAKLLVDNSITQGNPDIRKEAVVENGARVKAGQFLGKVGNSGASGSGPHLHVHMEKDGKPVVMTFVHGLTTPNPEGKADPNGPWTPLNGKAMPKADILFWPPRPTGQYTFNGVQGAAYQSLFDHMVDSGQMPDVLTCKSNGATYNSTWVPSQGAWRSHHGMSAAVAAAKHAAYTQQGFKRTSSFTCGSVSVAVWRK